MKLILASKNRGKLREMQDILEQLGVEVVLQSEAGIDIDVDETGETFTHNALLKARAVCKASGIAAVADDSGIVVDALGGRPGVYSARYGGDSCRDDVERYQLLLRELQNIPDEQRTARFVSAIACVFPNGTEITTLGECEGHIIHQPRGEGGFGYDPIFQPLGMTKTTSELTAEEKNQISHRGKALRAFAQKLQKDGIIC